MSYPIHKSLRITRPGTGPFICTIIGSNHVSRCCHIWGLTLKFILIKMDMRSGKNEDRTPFGIIHGK